VALLLRPTAALSQRADPARRTTAALLAGALMFLLALGAAAPASAAINPRDSLIYMPYGLVHFVRPASQVDEYLAEVDPYETAQLIFAMPKFKPSGSLKVPKHNSEMLARWASRAAAYDTAHGSALSVTVVFNGRVATARRGLDLDNPATRANIVSAVESSLSTGISGVQLDLEPYPVTSGYLRLLEELDAALARAGFAGRLSVASPATTSVWSPSYLKAVSQLITQLDPLYYDSESSSVGAYQGWMKNSLAYYTQNVSPATRIVPVLPSYSANRWHSPSVENIATASQALSEGLAAGSRINGAGIWWGWGFLFDEEGAYDGSADRGAWRSTTVNLAFSP
jgi:hypothetical protein